jgi:hypothetical protein
VKAGRTLIAGALLALALAPEGRAQPQTLFSEDFESGLDGWDSSSEGLWHVAPDGECGAVTAMAACNNGPASCDYQSGTGEPVYTFLRSPTFYLNGTPPWTFRFDYLKDSDAAGDLAAVSLYLSNGDEIEAPFHVPVPDAATPQQIVLMNSYNEVWWGESVRLVFWFDTDEVGNLGSGWMIDNIVVTSAGAWDDLGEAKPGSAGTPSLAGTGTLEQNTTNVLTLTSARPDALAALFFGLSTLHAPFKGGVMVPKPLVTIPMPTDPWGAARLPFGIPSGVPGGTNLYFQAWIPDPGASSDVAASNALVGITP